MTLFASPIPKAPAAVRVVFKTLIGRIRNTIETTYVCNPNPQLAYPRGTVVSFVELAGTSVDFPRQVAATTDSTIIPPPEQCKQQFVGVLEYDLAAANGSEPAYAVARHDGGPVYVRLDTNLNLHIGDALWATNNLATRGLATNVPPSNYPIYLGMVKDLFGYNPAATAGTSGCLAIVKHDAPTPLPPP